jgi:hypothetical protein
MANEKTYLAVSDDAFVAPPNGQVNGTVVLTNEAGTGLAAAAALPALPTANGDYTLRVASGVYSWVLEGT